MIIRKSVGCRQWTSGSVDNSSYYTTQYIILYQISYIKNKIPWAEFDFSALISSSRNDFNSASRVELAPGALEDMLTWPCCFQRQPLGPLFKAFKDGVKNLDAH